MKKSAKKRMGRPPGRKAAHRPVLSARVPEDVYELIKTAAESSGRTMSEEMVWRVRQTFDTKSAPRSRSPIADAIAQLGAEEAAREKRLDGRWVFSPRRRPEQPSEPDQGLRRIETPTASAPGVVITSELKAMLKDAIREVLLETKPTENGNT